MLAAIRHLDRGDRAGTRALLLTVDQAAGVSTLDLLKDGRFEEATGRVAGVRAPVHSSHPPLPHRLGRAPTAGTGASFGG